jgi:hypothetical protein
MAVNDFLASFSSLYDDMPPEERTKVLDSVLIAEESAEEDHLMKSSLLFGD